MLLNRVDTEAIKKALKPLADIADAFDANELDDEARKHWGSWSAPETNQTPHDQIELYTGRGGKRLLTLADCMLARDVLGTLP